MAKPSKTKTSGGDKIDLGEATAILSASFMSDFLEGIPFAGVIFGWIASAGIFLWSIFRGVRGKFYKKKIVLTTGGSLLDHLLFLGLLPIRSLVLLLTIILNNRYENKSDED